MVAQNVFVLYLFSSVIGLLFSTVDCRKKLRGYLDGLYNVYLTAVNGRGSLKVSPEDSLHLVEALRYNVVLGQYPYPEGSTLRKRNLTDDV